MLGRTCLRRLLLTRSYICLPCLRSEVASSSPRSLSNIEAATLSTHAALLPPEQGDLTSGVPAGGSDPARCSTTDLEDEKKGKKKAKGKIGTKQAETRKKGGQTSAIIKEKQEDNGSVGEHELDLDERTASAGTTGVKGRAKRVARAERKKKSHAARRKRAAAKTAKVMTHGQVLQRSAETKVVESKPAEDEAASVLSEAAKRPQKGDKAQSLKEALMRVKRRQKRRQKREFVDSVSAKEVELTPIDVEQPPIPQLSYGLDRVLFNPGVYHLQDPRCEVYNFDPYLQKIMPVADFDFDLLKKYVTSSQDEVLSDLARELGKRYVGSTSSMTAILAHFHFLLSSWRQLNIKMLSKGFSERLATFTRINRLPAAIFLRWKNGTYAIDADKQYDTANVLSMLGRSMEKLLTLPPGEYERYRKSSPKQIPDEKRALPEAYHYTTQGDMLMRSQLDSQDGRLPGTGMFDLKTRAVVSIRMDVQDWEQNTGYQIKTGTGLYESFEREYYDMMRSTMLKYSLQVRMGRMDGIFVAYHNIERIFGFQYISLDEMDTALHDNRSKTRHLGDQEFRLSVDLLNKALNLATQRFPDTSIRFHFETREAVEPFMYIFAEPMQDDEIRGIQEANKTRTEAWEKRVMGMEIDDAISVDTNPEPQHIRAEDVAARESGEMTSSGNDASDVQESSSKPLLGLKLFARSRIDGETVSRATHVTEDTAWTVDYQFEELTPKDTHKHYGACKNRRAVLLADPVLREEDVGQEEKVLSYYQRRLRGLSESGREWRKQKDEAQKGRCKVVLESRDRRTPANVVTPTKLWGSTLRDPISVDAYMRWLYGAQN